MRTLPPILVAIAVALGTACDGAIDTGGPDIVPNGVQIGSEGLLRDCDTESVRPDESVDGLDASPGELADALMQNWSTTLDSDLGPIVGSVGFTATGFNKLGGEDSDCLGVWLEVAAEAKFEPGVSADVEGNVRIDADGNAEFAVWSATWTGDLEPTFDPETAEIARVRFVGAMSPATLSGTAEFIGCDDTRCDSEEIGGLAGEPDPE